MIFNFVGKYVWNAKHCFQYFSRIVNSHLYLSTSVARSSDKLITSACTEINYSTIEYLEKVSLVGLEREKAVKILRDAIRVADKIFEVNTENIIPLATVLEDVGVHVRDDNVKNDVTRADLLSHCQKTEENYYITPANKVLSVN